MTDKWLEVARFTEAEARRAFDRIALAVGNDDRAAFARIVNYPLTVESAGGDVALSEAKDVVANYDKFVTPALKAVILTQSFDTLFITGRGGMYGSGELWFGGVCLDPRCVTHDVRIIAIHVM
jgi:hypothetical protein